MKKKGRGMSHDEKCEKMLSIFHSTKTIFNFDELEKASKKAGIPVPVVKKILEALKADNLVESEKIGIGAFYWSFPSKAYTILCQQVNMKQKQIATYDQQIAELEGDIGEAEEARQETDERFQLMEDVKHLRSMQKQLQKDVDELIRFDPERFELLKKQNKEVKDSINNETDNLEQIKKFIKQMNPGMTDKDIQEGYGIPADLDYVE